MKLRTLITSLFVLICLSGCSQELTYTPEQLERNNAWVEFYISEYEVSKAKSEEIKQSVADYILQSKEIDKQYKKFADEIKSLIDLYLEYTEDEEPLTAEQMLEDYMFYNIYIDKVSRTAEVVMSLPTTSSDTPYLVLTMRNGEVISVEERYTSQ